MSLAIVDDHLLRDVLSGDIGDELAAVLSERQLATTNLFYMRLCKSVVSARGGRLTGGWPEPQRLTRALVRLPASFTVAPLADLAVRMAELSDAHRLSTLGAEAIAAAEALEATLRVAANDDGPNIRAAAERLGVGYTAVRTS